MIFKETNLQGAFVIELQRIEDERGFFARTFCQNEFREHGLNPNLAQCNISYNKTKGTLRGMHFQAAPHQEAKLVRCTQGAIRDVIVDIRPDSPTYLGHFPVDLTAEVHNALYVPEGFAHGFLTLEPDTYVFYQMSEFHAPGFARGFHWDDPAIGIEWGSEVKVISERDANYPDYSDDLLK
ncbi:MAG: dTDP-4-dehydrorhamnose 3,5-epimerase [Anaerolineales bacterium]|nr:dTDP-4-dehydrorhamnose 3,5-epimerase [Anaerolineae bacterium]PWB70373.1 MAG: dTDP-4-dehydrorhamnose 3,5-epimerase [Anaerolineales bacterium]